MKERRLFVRHRAWASSWSETASGLDVFPVPTIKDVIKGEPLQMRRTLNAHNDINRLETSVECGRDGSRDGTWAWAPVTLNRQGMIYILIWDARSESVYTLDTFPRQTQVWCLASRGTYFAANINILTRDGGSAIFLYEHRRGKWQRMHSIARSVNAHGTMEFTSDCAHLALSNPDKCEITVIRCVDGDVVRKFRTTLESPYHMMEFEDGWLVTAEIGRKLVFVNEAREVSVCTFEGARRKGAIVLLPGVGPAVVTKGGLLCVIINGWDAIVDARMSAERMAWMMSVMRVASIMSFCRLESEKVYSLDVARFFPSR